MTVSKVNQDSIEAVWNKVAPMIERGLSHGAGDRTTSNNLKLAVYLGNALMWAIHDDQDIIAVVILSVHDRPEQKKCVFVEMVAGRDMRDWEDEVEELLIDYRDLIGATCIEASCRPGLIPKMKNWRTKAILMELT